MNPALRKVVLESYSCFPFLHITDLNIYYSDLENMPSPDSEITPLLNSEVDSTDVEASPAAGSRSGFGSTNTINATNKIVGVENIHLHVSPSKGLAIRNLLFLCFVAICALLAFLWVTWPRRP